MTTPKPQVRVFTFTGKPELGRGVLLFEQDGKQHITFETGERRVFKNASVLVEVKDLPADERAALDAKARGRSGAKSASAGKSGAKRGTKRASAKKAVAAAFPSFEAQVEWFENKFSGGFRGEAFTADERGNAEEKSVKKGYKEAAMKFAREELSPQRFESASPEELFASAHKLLGKTNIAFPQEGSIRFAKIDPEKRPALLAALRELLHGEGEYGVRLEKFAETVNLVDPKGKPTVATWPVATQFGALYRPEEQVVVKPTFFAGQGVILGIDCDVSTPVTAAKYEKLLAIARETERRLRAANHDPRDLMDVYSFIYRTHEGTKKPKAAELPQPV